MISTSEALHLSWPGWYRFGVRAEGSVDKLHSVYTKSDFLAVIMDAPVAIAMRKRPAVTVSISQFLGRIKSVVTKTLSWFSVGSSENLSPDGIYSGTIECTGKSRSSLVVAIDFGTLRRVVIFNAE